MWKTGLSIASILIFLFPAKGHASNSDLELFQRQLKTDLMYQLELLKYRPHITGIEILRVEPAYTYLESIVGHALLRFLDDDGDPFNDYVINFRALVDEPNGSIYKGLIGNYLIQANVLHFRDFIRGYVVQEGEALHRIPLKLSAQSIDRIFDVLRNWFYDPNAIGRYTWLRRNCSGAIMYLFNEAGIVDDVPLIPRPALLESFFSSHGLVGGNSILIPTSGELISRLAAFSGLRQKEIKNGNLPDELITDLQVLDRLQLARFLTEIPITKGNISFVNAALEYLTRNGAKYSLARAYNIE